MLLPELPEALIVRRNAHGFSHSFTALQMDKYGRDCAESALEHAASACEAQADQLHTHQQVMPSRSFALQRLEVRNDTSTSTKRMALHAREIWALYCIPVRHRKAEKLQPPELHAHVHAGAIEPIRASLL